MERHKCAAQHFGLWAIEPRWLTEAWSAIRMGQWTAHAATPENQRSDQEWVHWAADGIALLSIDGQMTKGESSFGGTSSVALRKQLRSLASMSSVKGIMLRVDSPGGTVAGTQELAAEVKAARDRKPVRAHIDDLGASAAYWVSSQAERLTANRMAQIGSIGTMAVVHDYSGAAEMEGIKVHVVSTGAYKGAFTPGAPVTEEHLADLQSLVDGMNQEFLKAVRSGRQMTADTLKPLADGRVWLANDAAAHGLIDGVMSFDDAVKEFARDLRPSRREAAARKLRLA